MPQVLAEIGVRLVIVEPLARSRIDGAAFWLGEDQPVIVLSLRFDRIDAFWHTLAHELIHIKHGDNRFAASGLASVDSDLVGESRSLSLNEVEARADSEGAALLVDPEKLSSFIVRTRPLYSKERIIQFSKRLRVHPGIVNGQLQHRKEVGWGANREMLAKVRDLITTVTITDGWGQVAPRPKTV